MNKMALTVITVPLLPFLLAGYIAGWLAIGVLNGWLWAFRTYDHLYKDFKK